MNKWEEFYRPFFPSDDQVQGFIEACERQAPPNNVAKVLMHQAQRLVSISDDIQQIRPHNEPLRLVFLLICAEHIAKLYHGYSADGQSRKYVSIFFDEYLCDRDRRILCNSFVPIEDAPPRPLPLGKVVDLLYEVRCDVVHEGKTWGLTFHDGVTSMVNVDPAVEIHLTFQDLRDMVVRGCISAITLKL